MPLPTKPLPRSSIDIDGTTIDFRALSRSEHMQLNGLRADPDRAEVLMLAWATDSTEDEATAFRATTLARDVATLSDAIIVFSGIMSADQVARINAGEAAEAVLKGSPDPKIAIERGFGRGELDLTPFIIGHFLKLTLGEVNAMSQAEYDGWRAFITYRDAMLSMAGSAREKVHRADIEVDRAR